MKKTFSILLSFVLLFSFCLSNPFNCGAKSKTKKSITQKSVKKKISIKKVQKTTVKIAKEKAQQTSKKIAKKVTQKSSKKQKLTSKSTYKKSKSKIISKRKHKKSRLIASRGMSFSRHGEMLDWWTEASKIFSRGSVAYVTDVRTGRTFQIKRTFGTNHADCEALTDEDTAIIKSIWGGFTWDVRPVVVHVKGRDIAASMSAMPHAGVDAAPALATVGNRSEGYGRGTNLDEVKDNGMSGHIDVHFLNSTRHKDGKEDPRHQAAVREAAGK